MTHSSRFTHEIVYNPVNLKLMMIQKSELWWDRGHVKKNKHGERKTCRNDLLLPTGHCDLKYKNDIYPRGPLEIKGTTLWIYVTDWVCAGRQDQLHLLDSCVFLKGRFCRIYFFTEKLWAVSEIWSKENWKANLQLHRENMFGIQSKIVPFSEVELLDFLCRNFLLMESGL